MTRSSRALAVAFTGALCVVFFFRFQLRNGGRLLNGDRYDGMIQTAILEHWYNVLRGAAHWSTTNYFFPAPATLGYNDGYLLFGILYAAFRALGADPFLGAELVNAALRAIAFVAFYAVGRRIGALPVPLALLAATLFTVANNMFLQAYHAQLFAIGFIPVMALLVGATLRAFWAGRPKPLVAWGVASAAFYAAWLLTAYYMAWFFAFFMIVMGVVYGVASGRDHRRDVLARALAQRGPLAAIALTGGVLALPFLWLYLPKARQTGMHAYEVVLSLSPTVLDAINVGPGNLAWGALVRFVGRILPDGGFSAEEAGTGLPLLLVGLFLMAVVVLWRARRRTRGERPTLPFVLAVATLVTWLLALRVGDHSGWWLVYHLVPGAQAVRAVTRVQLFLVAPIVLVVVATLAQLRGRGAALGVAAVGALLLLENVNALPPLGLERPQEIARLQRIGTPPRECRAFFASSARAAGLYDADTDARYSHNVDAMIVAEVTNVPTINGFASFAPPSWELSRPAAADYRERVDAYATANGVRGLCALDLTTLRWDAHPALPER